MSILWGGALIRQTVWWSGRPAGHSSFSGHAHGQSFGCSQDMCRFANAHRADCCLLRKWTKQALSRSCSLRGSAPGRRSRAGTCKLAGQLGTSDFIGFEHGSLRAEASVLAILKEDKTMDTAYTRCPQALWLPMLQMSQHYNSASPWRSVAAGSLRVSRTRPVCFCSFRGVRVSVSRQANMQCRRLGTLHLQATGKQMVMRGSS